MKRFAQLIAMLLCLAMVLTACGGGDTSSAASESSAATESSAAASGDASESTPAEESASSKADKNSLVYAVAAEPGQLDPQNNAILPGMMIEKQIFDPLIDKDPETGEFIPALATEWEWTDSTHLKLTLREGVKWHDGSDFTSADVVYTVGRFAEGSATASLYAAFDAANTVANGDYEVTIAFKYEFAPAINFIAHNRAFIVNQNYVETNGQQTFGQQPMGTGAFKFVEWVVGSHVNLVRNDEYWGTVPSYENLTVRFITDDTARMVALETGEIDIASEIQAEDIERAMNGEVEGVIGYTTPSYKVWYLSFNYNFEPFQSKEVRLAMAHAVDWEAACEVAGGMTVEAAQSCLASTIFGYEAQGIYEYDPELSKQLLAEAGYADGFEVTCVEEEIPVAVRMIETVQAYLAEVGITMNIQVVDTPTWQEGLTNGTSQLTVGNMTAMTGDPMHTLNQTVDDAVQITGKVEDEHYNELFDQGAAEMDETARAEIYQELQQYVYENAFQIPMYQQIITYGVRDYIDGFIPDAGLQLDLKVITIK